MTTNHSQPFIVFELHRSRFFRNDLFLQFWKLSDFYSAKNALNMNTASWSSLFVIPFYRSSRNDLFLQLLKLSDFYSKINRMNMKTGSKSSNFGGERSPVSLTVLICTTRSRPYVYQA